MDELLVVAETLRIQSLKAKYFRSLDTKAWEDFRSVFADDLMFWRDESLTERSVEPITTDADTFVASIRNRHETSTTVHHGHCPEIEILSPSEARGSWALFDWVDNPDARHAWQGYGYYFEEYVKSSVSWQISRMRLARIRIEPMTVSPLEGIRLVNNRWQAGQLLASDGKGN